MYTIERTNQTDSPSLSIGEFHTGTGHARRTPASKNRYILDEHPIRVRGTPEYNPLYDAYQSDFVLPARPQRQPATDFKPITPPPVRFVHNSPHDMEDPYDRPRSYRRMNEQNSAAHDQRYQSEYQPKRVESSQHSEIDLLMDKLGGETTPNDDTNTCNQRKTRRRRHILNNTLDFLAILFTCLIFGLIYLLIKPVKRGFFCDDTSIQYPFRPDTIPMWVLGLYGGLGPVLIFCIVEIWVVRPFHCRRGQAGNSLKQRQVDYLKAIFHTIFLFLLGVAVCFLITEVGKRTIGRLRPYYLTVCNPIWANLNCTKTVATANGPLQIAQYIINHNCNSSASDRDLQEAQLSFPSGHSSYSTYAFMFLFVYFEARLVCPNIQFLKPFLQCLCVAIAFFTCLSRVTDYKHHATDVIGGALIGFCIAIFTAVRVGTYLWSFSVYCETEEETKKDRLPKEERLAVPGVETKNAGELRSNEPQNVSSATSRSRNGNRSNYDNVALAQQQRNIPQPGRATSGQRVSPGRGYEEANV